MPGSLVSIAVAPGDVVEAGDELAVVEAMKMRNVLRSEQSGTIDAVLVEAGAVLQADEVLIRFK
jgi:biotin carboxyl carrier protein